MLTGSAGEAVFAFYALIDLQELQSVSPLAFPDGVFGETLWARWVLTLCGDDAVHEPVVWLMKCEFRVWSFLMDSGGLDEPWPYASFVARELTCVNG